MQTIRRWASTAALVSSLSLAPAATAASIGNLVVFGDSLSDPGNAAALTLLDPAPPPANPVKSFFPPTPTGRFSNGPTAAEYLAGIYGVPVVKGWPSAAGANNMAAGGALTGNGNYNFIINDPFGLNTYTAVGSTGASQQIAAFAAANPTALANADTLTMLWAGPNDFFLGFALASDPVAVVTSAVNNMAGNIVALFGAGARNILVPNMPDLGQTPALIGQGAAAAAGASAISAAYNANLYAAVDQLQLQFGSAGLRLFKADTAGLLIDAIEDPASFGFTNVNEACIDSPVAIAANCAGYLFFDGVHPTTAAHQLLAGEFAAAVPEPSTYALLALGLAALLVFARRRAA
jgi:phospholipase/lecithinase/hemolysin